MPKDQQMGTLVVVILKARNLNDKHSFYKQDVLAEASLNGGSQRTPTDVKGGQHPVWDAELRFPIMEATSDKYRKLEISCYAKEPKSDDLLGQGIVDITETLRSGEFDDWVSLQVAGVSRGEIYLEMTYYAAALKRATLSVPLASDLSRRPSKLSPSERLSRPSKPFNPPKVATPHHQKHFNETSTDWDLLQESPASSRSTSGVTSHIGLDAPLSPLAEGHSPRPPIPTFLVPGDGRRPPQSTPGQAHSIFRPENLNSGTPIPSNHARTPSSPTPTQTRMTDSVKLQNTYAHISSGPQPVPGPSPAVQPNSVYTSSYDNRHPVIQRQSDVQPVTLTFPMPTVVPPAIEPFNFQSQYRSPGLRGSPSPRPDPLSQDPYLQARYQTPLPLPPGSKSPLRGHEPSERDVDATQIEALRIIEREAENRRQQEQKDLELALALDREFNDLEQPNTRPAKPTGNGSGMPGAW